MKMYKITGLSKDGDLYTISESVGENVLKQFVADIIMLGRYIKVDVIEIK